MKQEQETFPLFIIVVSIVRNRKNIIVNAHRLFYCYKQNIEELANEKHIQIRKYKETSFIICDECVEICSMNYNFHVNFD